MKNKWLSKSGDLLVPTISEVVDSTADLLQKVSISGDSAVDLSPFEEDLKNLKKRKLVQQVTRKSYKVLKGPEFKEKRVRKVADLTKSMLGSKSDVRIKELQINKNNNNYHDYHGGNMNIN